MLKCGPSQGAQFLPGTHCLPFNPRLSSHGLSIVTWWATSISFAISARRRRCGHGRRRGIACARRFGVPGVTKPTNIKRLAVVETLMVGPRQRLIIFRRDNVEHVVRPAPKALR